MNAQEMIASFAKANKISKSKLEAFANELLSSVPKVNGSSGRPTSDESLRIREAIKQSREELSGKVFTAKELANMFNTSPISILNNVKWLSQHEGIVSEVGKKQKDKGVRGRQETLWKIA